MPKRWLIVGSSGIRNTRANLYLSGEPVGLDVRGRQHHALAAPWDETVERGLCATTEDGFGTAPLVARRVEQVLVERGLFKRLALFRGRNLQQQLVDLTHRGRQRLAVAL